MSDIIAGHHEVTIDGITMRETARILDLLADLREDFDEDTTEAPVDPSGATYTEDEAVEIKSDNPFNASVSGGSYRDGWNQALTLAVRLVLENRETLAEAYHHGTLAEVLNDGAKEHRL
jgi:hypothetical protein